MPTVTRTRVYNRSDRFVEGWYWAIPAREVKRGQIKPLRMLGRDLVVWRGDDGVARIMDAYCPHMGAHLAEGSVDGNAVRCFFHHWKFDGDGQLIDIPCQDKPIAAKLKTWPTDEAYGMIWVWAGDTPRHPVPFIPEVDGQDLAWHHGNAFEKGCHPNVVMVNAIDEQHFHSVHPMASSLADGLRFDISSLNDNCQMFDNAHGVPDSNPITRFLSRFYDGPLTYRMVYWNGTTGSVTVGPDFWHFHIIFALRPTDRGTCEGQTLLVSPKVSGIAGRVWNRIALGLTRIVGDYFAKGDTEVFQTIQWDFANPIRADRPIIEFIRHVEEQKVSAWGTWAPLEDAVESAA